MKATELMIGDLVYCTFWVQKRIERVWELKRAANDELRVAIMDEVHLVFKEKYFEPIPLTAEILEKNGFTCDANGMNDSDEPVVSVEYGEFQRNTDDGFKMLADGKAIKYVHELQHALRLCGIEKEVVL